MTAARALALLALLAVALPADAASAPLGRLFFTPERRAEFETRRHAPRRGSRQDRGGGPMRLDGIVVSGGGAATVWVDGKAQRRRADALVPSVPGAAALAIGDGAPVQLRVGEAIDRGTRKKKDVVAADAIRIGGKPAHGR